LILFLNSVVTLSESHEILYLMMGSLEAQGMEVVIPVGLIIAGGIVILMYHSSAMNLVSLGEESASQLGLDVERHRKILFFAASLVVGAAVSVSGLIGFVGLFVPHMIRLLFGVDHRMVLSASAIGGALFLVLCDYGARAMLAYEIFQTQLPVGVVTALFGGPFFDGTACVGACEAGSR